MPAQDTAQPWWTNWNLSYADNVYGPIYGGHSVQEACYNTLQKWLPAYIHEFNRKLGGEILTVPTEYKYQPDERPFTREVSASILVVCGGTVGEPKRLSNATWSDWSIQASACVIGTKDWQETEALTFAYGAAVRTAIAQHPSLGGLAKATLWTGEKYMRGTRSSTRQVGLAIIDFQVTLPQTMNPNAGPPEPQFAGDGVITDPSILPPQPIPTVKSTEVDIS